MGQAVGIVSQLGLSDLWKYVFNSMECHSNCCEDFIVCECITKEVEVDSYDGDCAHICFGCDKDIADTSTSYASSLFSRDDV